MASKKQEAMRKTIEKRQDEIKKDFLKKLEETPVIQVVASHCGVHRSTYYRWIDEDSDFKRAAEESLKKGILFVSDMMESLLIKAAKEGGLTAVIFWLKNHHPMYIDRRRYEYMHEFKENPLTEERIKQIAMAMKNWSSGDDDDEPDYTEYGNDGLPEQEDNNEFEELPKLPAPIEVKIETPPPRTGVATYYKPKKR